MPAVRPLDITTRIALAERIARDGDGGRAAANGIGVCTQTLLRAFAGHGVTPLVARAITAMLSSGPNEMAASLSMPPRAA